MLSAEHQPPWSFPARLGDRLDHPLQVLRFCRKLYVPYYILK